MSYPVFEVTLPEYDYVFPGVQAYDAETAATQTVERWERESADYRCVSGQDIDVIVREPGEEPQFFTVSGESVPVYSAHRS